MTRKIGFNNRTCLSIVMALALSSTSHLALARDLDNEEATIGGAGSAQHWTLRNGSTLHIFGPTRNVRSTDSTVNLIGGSTWELRATNSIVNVSGGAVQSFESIFSTVNASGLTVNGSASLRNGTVANFSGSTIENTTGVGLFFANDSSAPGPDLGAVGNFSGSAITGLGLGASIVSNGVLNLSGSSVFGRDDGLDLPYAGGFGIRLAQGTANIGGNSYVAGDKGGVLVFQSNYTGQRNLTVDGSTVEGLTGAAIAVVGVSGRPTDADIVVQNGSRLIGGNGNILEVDQYSTARFTADDSRLTGDVVVEAGGQAAVTLRNNASLTGQLTGVENLAVDSGGVWHMVGDGGVTNLAMSGGGVAISDGSGASFNALTIDNLSGSGTFYMGTDLGAAVGDLLVVTGNATGDHLLHVANTGVEPVSENALKVVDTAGGSAQFALVGDFVDIGTYKYLLEQDGDDWSLVGTNMLTPGTKTAIGLASATPSIWYGEAASLRSRLGDLHMGETETGVWSRAYGREYSVGSGAGQAYDHTQGGFSVGVDTPFAFDNGQLLAGALAGYSHSNLDFGFGSTGKVDSYYAGIYGTWLADDGFYVDGLVKVNRFDSTAGVVMSDGTGAVGNYDTYGIGGQIEIGRNFALQNNWFVEPFAQLAAMQAGGNDYTLDNGMQVENATMSSLVARIGGTVGVKYELENGAVVQPYVKVAIAQEFADDNKVWVNGNQFNNDLSGLRGEIGFGVAAQLTDALQLHADFDYANGKNIEQKWGANIGLRYAF
jgi:outer membrane autotransporter protein